MNGCFAWALGLAAWLWASAAMAEEFDPYAGSRPVIVLLQSDPWAEVIGSDVPQLVAYEDRTVLYQEGKDAERKWMKASLDESQFKEVVSKARPILQLAGARKVYSVVGPATDQPSTSLYVSEGGQAKAIHIYGLTRRGPSRSDLPANKEEEPPQEFLEVCQHLANFSISKSAPWNIRYVEVMLWRYDCAPEASIMWPKEWPGLDSPRAKKRGEAFSVYLDGDQLNALKILLASRPERGALEVGGKKFAVSYRFAMPSEPVWMKAFGSAEE